MGLIKSYKPVSWCIVALLAVTSLTAGEHHGLVKFAGLGMPGASVTLTQGDKKVTAITAPDGDYAFPEIADGTWQIQIEMMCFAPITREVVVGPGALPAQWELKMLPIDEMKTVNAAPAPPPIASPTTTTAAATPRCGRAKCSAR